MSDDFLFFIFFIQSKNIVLEKTVEYITQVNDQLKEFSDLQQREQKLGKKSLTLTLSYFIHRYKS